MVFAVVGAGRFASARGVGPRRRLFNDLLGLGKEALVHDLGFGGNARQDGMGDVRKSPFTSHAFLLPSKNYFSRRSHLTGLGSVLVFDCF